MLIPLQWEYSHASILYGFSPHMKKSVKNKKLLMAVYRELVGRFGHRNWWPAETPFEVCVGAILTQNTSWKNVVKAIANLKLASALDAHIIHRMPLEELAALIRPAGYFNVKARRLKNFVDHLVEKHDGNLSLLFNARLPDLREELLSINGVGKETADSIVLYAAEKPIFVVDAYTRRVLHRHGIIEEMADYDSIQSLFHANLPPDVPLYNDFHAQLVAVGHHFCGRKPRCHGCPLEAFLPESIELPQAVPG
jgi:endonuclease III related protein